MGETRMFKNENEFREYSRNQVEIPVVEVLGRRRRKRYALVESFTNIEEARKFIEGTNYMIWHHNSEVH